jgi:amidohydrolase
MRFPSLFASLSFACAIAASSGVCAATQSEFEPAVRAHYQNELGALFKHFHANPELSFREFNTGARMAKELRRLKGIEVTEKVAGTGVVGVLRNGDGPVVMIRADMDGLPVLEDTGLAYASKAKQVDSDGVEYPVMHACGHDVHITSLLATAKLLLAQRKRWSGTVVFIVQPAEERIGGAKAMIADGLFERFPKPNYALALHVASELPSGMIAAAEGIQYSSSDSVNLTIKGIGTHGASPHMGRDPVYLGAQIVNALQGIISREKQPLQPGVITVGAFHAGNKHNIISDRAELQLTVRSNDQATRDQLIAAIERVARGEAIAAGLPENLMPEVKIVESTPVTQNDAELARRLNQRIASSLGKQFVIPYQQRGMGAEDFAFFVDPKHGIKGYYFAVGGTPAARFAEAKNGGPAVSGHHSPFFKIEPEEPIVIGALAMSHAVLDLLAK